MKKIKFKEIKELLNKNSIEVFSNISDDEIFSGIKTISNASDKDLSFFSNQRYLDSLKNIKAKACLYLFSIKHALAFIFFKLSKYL